MDNYTVVKVKFNHQGVICERVDLGLKPMTEKEAVTFKSKMMKPSDYRVISAGVAMAIPCKDEQDGEN